VYLLSVLVPLTRCRGRCRGEEYLVGEEHGRPKYCFGSCYVREAGKEGVE
jgi:hypothetical protein